ncbi:MAG: cupin domain-containing protein [Deltaproteobacteria bacterium]
MDEVRDIIETYRLEPHPEGGWFREFHRSVRPVGPLPGVPGIRPAVTAIHFLLTRETFSAFHRLRSEEIWIHLAGAPLSLVLLGPDASRLRLAGAADGGPPALVVPAGALQAARTDGAFAFAACVVAPGFDYADLEIPSRHALLLEFPGHAELVRTFTR